METFLVERYLPDLSDEDVRAAASRLRAAVRALRRDGRDVRYAGSLFVPEEESCFCQFQSLSAAAVREANERARFPFARITRALAISADDDPSDRPGPADRRGAEQ